MSFPWKAKETLVIPAEAGLGAVRYLVTIGDEDFSLLHWDGPGETVLIIHANGFSAGTYAPLAQKLQSRGYNVAGIDLRGHGRTGAAWVKGRDNWLTFGTDLSKLINQADRPLHIMGHSLGGLSAIYAAADRPGNMASLCLLDPTMFGPQLHLYFNILKWSGKWRRLPIVLNTIHRVNNFPTAEAAFRHYRPKKVFAPWSDEFLWGYVLSATREAPGGGVELSCDPAVEAELFATTPHYIFHNLKKITPPPTILLYGEYSYVVSRPAVRAFRRCWPAATVQEIAGGGHFYPMSHTDYVLAVWEKWLSGLKARGIRS